MPVIDVKEIWNGANMTLDDMGERTYLRVFRVLTDSPFTGQLSVLFAPGIPRRFTVYSDPDGTLDPLAFVQEIDCEHDQDDPQVWVVKVKYNSKLQQPDQGDEDPLARPTIVEFGTTKFSRVADKDKDGNAITNSAEDPYDPPIEVERYHQVIVMERNEQFFGADLLVGQPQDYIGTINSDAWFGQAPLTVMCRNATGTHVYEKGIFYYRCKYEFEINSDTWIFKPLDQGFRAIDNTDGPTFGETLIIRDALGAAVSQPALLDGTGGELLSGHDPVFLSYHIYDELPFAGLNLP